MVLRGTGSIASDAEDPGYVPGFWYMMQDGNVAAGAAVAAGTVRLVPFRLRQLVSIAQIGARITTLAAGGLLQLGIYSANRDTLLPSGQVLARTAGIATDAAGNVAGTLLNNAGVAVPSVLLPRGVYWFGSQVDATAGGTVILTGPLASGVNFGALVGASLAATILSGAATGLFIRSIASAFGAWPDLTAPAATSESAGSTASAVGMFLVAP